MFLEGLFKTSYLLQKKKRVKLMMD